MKLTYLVTSSDNFANVKEILKTKFQISDRLLVKLKNQKKILLNSNIAFVNSKVKISDKIEVDLDFEEDNSNIPSTEMDLDIIYEDESYLIVNKPAGIPVHPSMDHYKDSLSNGIKYYFDSIAIHKKIRPVNRLDKNTSGIVIFAKNEYIQECLVRQMKEDTFVKEYIAICDGIFEQKQGTINAPIARKENSIIERCINKNGANSITHYKVLKEFRNNDNSYSIVKCKLETGRTHQIRVHMQYIGHPLLGDTLYARPSTLINRQALHSYKTSFVHPISNKAVTYIAPLPEDMNMFYK